MLHFYVPHMSEQKIPISLCSVQAGFPSPADDFLEGKLDLNQLCIEHPSATFFVRVDGDSMEGANIHKGDILIVDRAKNPADRKIVIAVINGEFTVKRIRMKEKAIYLEPENPKFPLIKTDPNWDFEIWGIVTYIIHKAV